MAGSPGTADCQREAAGGCSKKDSDVSASRAFPIIETGTQLVLAASVPLASAITVPVAPPATRSTRVTVAGSRIVEFRPHRHIEPLARIGIKPHAQVLNECAVVQPGHCLPSGTESNLRAQLRQKDAPLARERPARGGSRCPSAGSRQRRRLKRAVLRAPGISVDGGITWNCMLSKRGCPAVARIRTPTVFRFQRLFR